MQPTWRHVPPLLLPPSMPLLKSLYIDFPFQVRPQLGHVAESAFLLLWGIRSTGYRMQLHAYPCATAERTTALGGIGVSLNPKVTAFSCSLQVTSNLSISLGFSTLSIHSAQRLMLMKTGVLWREPTSTEGSACPCCPRQLSSGDTDCEASSAAGCTYHAASRDSCCALLEVEETVLERLKDQLGAPVPSAQAAAVAGRIEASAIRNTDDPHWVQPHVVAYLLLNDSNIIAIHSDGSLCMIRRKEKPPTGPSRIFGGSEQAPL